jgi:hypothetical protein
MNTNLARAVKRFVMHGMNHLPIPLTIIIVAPILQLFRVRLFRDASFGVYIGRDMRREGTSRLLDQLHCKSKV